MTGSQQRSAAPEQAVRELWRGTWPLVLTVVAAVALIGLGEMLVDAVDAGQRVTYLLAALITIVSVLFELASWPRDWTVRARRIATPFRGHTWVILLLSTSVVVVSFGAPDWRLALMVLLASVVLWVVAGEAGRGLFLSVAALLMGLAVVTVTSAGSLALERRAQQAADRMGEEVREVKAALCADQCTCPDSPTSDSAIACVEVPDPRFAVTEALTLALSENGLSHDVAALERLKQRADDLDIHVVRDRLEQALGVTTPAMIAKLAQVDEQREAGPLELQRRQHQALVELRRLAAARRPAELEQAQLTAALDGLEAAVSPPVDVGFSTLLTEGVDTLVRQALPDLDSDERRFDVDLWGYVLLALAVMTGFRFLQLRNNRQYGTPVVVQDVSGIEKEYEAEAVRQRLQERIMEAGVPDPGPLPGGTTSKDLSTAFAQAEGLPQNKLAGAAIELVQKVAFPPPGVTVTLAVTAASKTNSVTGSVELRTRVAERFVASSLIQAATITDLVDQAADFVATNALNFSRSTPPWQRWQDRSGKALGCYRRVQASGEEMGRDERRRLLQSALAESPATATVRMALANQMDVDKDRLDALRLHLHTAMDYPLHFPSRYRLATSLMMLAQSEDLHDHWLSNPVGRNSVLESLLDRYVDGHDGSREEIRAVLTSTAAPQVSARLRAMAEDELTQLLRFTSGRWMVWLALNRSQRSALWNLLRERERRMQRRSAYKTVRIGGRIRDLLSRPGHDAKPLQAHLADLRKTTPWTGGAATAHYNAACIYADLVSAKDESPNALRLADHDPATDRDLAFRHLEVALRRGGPALVSAAWLEKDPDLARLREDEERFQQLVARYSTGPREGST